MERAARNPIPLLRPGRSAGSIKFKPQRHKEHKESLKSFVLFVSLWFNNGMKPKQPTKQKRLVRFKEIKVEPGDGGQCLVSVELACKENIITGERSGPDEPDYKIMLSALSTLDALQKATDDQLKMELLFIERQHVQKVKREIIMVMIDVHIDDSTRAATGACQIKDDPLEAASRAVLDATNRIMELFFE